MIAALVLATLFADVPATVAAHRGAVVGVELGGAGVFGAATSGAGGGVAARAVGGYELAAGFMPNVSVEGTRFGSAAGTTWELAALPGMRWYALTGRVRWWLEGAAGFGQFVYENNSPGGRVDVGLRLRGAGGLDFALDPLVSVGVHVAVNDQRAEISDDHWIDAGFDVTFPF